MHGTKTGKYRRLILAMLLSMLALGGLPIQSPALELVVALDTSGSMKQNDPHQLLPQAVRLLVTLVQPQDRLGLLTFEDGAALRLPVSPLTPAHNQQALAELKKLAPRGLYTDLYAALEEGLKAFPGEDRTPSRALILLTDGQMDINPQKGQSADFTARLIQEVLPQYQERKIPIYAVAFTEQSDQKLLQQLADQTGGRFLLVQQAADLYLAFATIYEELEHPQTAPVIGDQFMIDASVQEATLIISRARPRTAVALIDPQGKKISFKNVRPPIKWFATNNFDLITIPQPKPGRWRLVGHQNRGNRVILVTDVQLQCPFLPYAAGQDEEIIIAAGLAQRQILMHTKPLLETTIFSATLESSDHKQKFVYPLEATGLGLPGSWPQGLRVGRLPPLEGAALWHLSIQALGKTWQRQQNFSLPIIAPWFVPQVQPQSPDGQVTIKFTAATGRQAQGLEGWLSVKKPSGQIQASRLSLEESKDFQFNFQPPVPGTYEVTLQLSGTTDQGRPLLIRSPVVAVEVPAALASQSTAADSNSPSGRSELIIRLAIGLIAILVLAGLTVLLFRFWQRRSRLSPARSIAVGDEVSLPFEKENLLLKAQVMSLKETLAQVEAANQALEKEIKLTKVQNAAEQEELRKELEHYQQQARMVGQLETRLHQAENDAKNMQEEYLALFSRTQQDKDIYKKD